jgi:MoxR-like ATPase
MSDAVRDLDHAAARDLLEDAQREIRRVLVGQQRMLDRILAALLSGGTACSRGSPGWARR